MKRFPAVYKRGHCDNKTVGADPPPPSAPAGFHLPTFGSNSIAAVAAYRPSTFRRTAPSHAPRGKPCLPTDNSIGLRSDRGPRRCAPSTTDGARVSGPQPEALSRESSILPGPRATNVTAGQVGTPGTSKLPNLVNFFQSFDCIAFIHLNHTLFFFRLLLFILTICRSK